MVVSQVGTPAALSGTNLVTSGTGAKTVTGIWSASQPRNAGDLLVALVTCFGSTSSTLPSAPSGWTLQGAGVNATQVSVGIYTATAAGADAAPAFTSTISGTSSHTRLTCELIELQGQDPVQPVPSGGSGYASGTTGNVTPATTATIPRVGCFGLSAFCYGNSSTGTGTWVPATAWTNSANTFATSTYSHAAFDWISPATAGGTLSEAGSSSISHAQVAGAVLLIQSSVQAQPNTPTGKGKAAQPVQPVSAGAAIGAGSAQVPHQVPFLAGVVNDAANGGYFTDQNGAPRLWVASETWGLVLRAGEWTTPTGDWQGDYDSFFSAMASQGITVSLLDPIGPGTADGPTSAPANGVTWDGVVPFSSTSPITFNDPFWQRIDYMLASALKNGIAVGMTFNLVYTAVTGGVMNGWTTTQYQQYGAALGARYASQPNIIWMAGNDEYPTTNDAKYDAILSGLASQGAGPSAGQMVGAWWSAEYTSRYETDNNLAAAWGKTNSAFNFCYTYNAPYWVIEYAYKETQSPDSETARLTALVGDGYWYQGGATYATTQDRAIRQDAWWVLASGGRGIITQAENVNPWSSPNTLTYINTNWYFVNNLPNIVSYYTSLAGWHKLVPDLSSALVTAGRGTRVSGFAAGGSGGQYEPAFTNSWVAAAVTPDKTLAVLYLPNAATITIDQTQIGPGYTATWVDPVSCVTYAGTVGATYNSGAVDGSKPVTNSQGDPDWVLVLRSSSATASPSAASGAGSAGAPFFPSTPAWPAQGIGTAPQPGILAVSSGGGTVTLDAVGPGATGAGGTTGTLTSPLTWSHTNNGNAITVGVTIYNGATNTITAVTYGGVALSLLGFIQGGSGGAGGVALYGKVGGLPTGANTVSVSFSDGANHNAGSISFSGAAGFGTPVTASATNTTSVTASVAGTTAGGMVAAAASFGGTGLNTFSGTNGVTVRWQHPGSTNTGADNGVGGTVASAGGTQTVGFSDTGSDYWGIVAAELTGASAPPVTQVTAGSAAGAGWAGQAQTAAGGGGTTASAGAAAGTGGAAQPSGQVTDAPPLAAGSGTAAQPPVLLAGAAGSAAGAGQSPQPSASGSASAAAGAAAGSGLAAQPSASGSETVTPGPAASSGRAAAPAAPVTASAGAAAGSGTSPDPAASEIVTAGPASGTGTSPAPADSGSETASAGSAAGSGSAAQPSVAASGSTTAAAGPGSGAGLAPQPAAWAQPSAGAAASSGRASQPSAAVAGLPPAVPGAGTAAVPATVIGAPAGPGSGAGSAPQPPASGSVTASAGPASGAGLAPQPPVSASGTATAGIASGAGRAPAPQIPAGSQAVSSADSARAVESAFYYITGADTAHGAEGPVSVRLSGKDAGHSAEQPLNAWPSRSDSARGKDFPASAWPEGDDSAHAAEAYAPFRFARSDSGQAFEVLHEMGIWTYLPAGVRLLGRFWRVTGTDEDGNEVVIFEAERLTGQMLELAEAVNGPLTEHLAGHERAPRPVPGVFGYPDERPPPEAAPARTAVPWSRGRRTVRKLSSGDAAGAAERVTRPPVGVTCWVQPAVTVLVEVTEVAAEAVR